MRVIDLDTGEDEDFAPSPASAPSQGAPVVTDGRGRGHGGRGGTR